MTGPRMNHVEARSNRRPARQYVSETHDHKPDAPSRAEPRSAAKHTAGTAAGGRTIVDDILDDLAGKVRRSVIEACVAVTKISRVSKIENEYQRGYNQACDDIAVRIAALAKTGGAS